jgi:hypothetical protein
MDYEHRNPFESFPEIRVTKENLRRLDTMLVDHTPIRSWRAVEFLVRELMRATVIDPHEIPAQVATMGSRVAPDVRGRRPDVPLRPASSTRAVRPHRPAESRLRPNGYRPIRTTRKCSPARGMTAIGGKPHAARKSAIGRVKP